MSRRRRTSEWILVRLLSFFQMTDGNLKDVEITFSEPDFNHLSVSPPSSSLFSLSMSMACSCLSFSAIVFFQHTFTFLPPIQSEFSSPSIPFLIPFISQRVLTTPIFSLFPTSHSCIIRCLIRL